ncbi:hypothetical protein EAH89_20850 [Roseomonas nepalensis]|uniref:Uncharacterized protein n=1 Tax=Muricoccus nepalensis TaxID=1854500 RepID=A0A502FKB2_9PROT|nr:hypothetical protein EAH89_20850 [Roseomonas nepalensis]
MPGADQGLGTPLARAASVQGRAQEVAAPAQAARRAGSVAMAAISPCQRLIQSAARRARSGASVPSAGPPASGPPGALPSDPSISSPTRPVPHGRAAALREGHLLVLVRQHGHPPTGPALPPRCTRPAPEEAPFALRRGGSSIRHPGP